MFTMAIVTLSAYKTENAMLNLRVTTVPYWMLPWVHIALQFILTLNSPLRTTLLLNNLAGFAIGRSYKFLTDVQPIRHKLNNILGTHLD